MKRLLPVLSLFLLMCFIGGGVSVFLAQNAMAYGTLPPCDGDCTPIPNGRFYTDYTCTTGHYLGYTCPPESPYAEVAIYSFCSGSGYCSDYVVIGCHDDPFGNCD